MRDNTMCVSLVKHTLRGMDAWSRESVKNIGDHASMSGVHMG